MDVTGSPAGNPLPGPSDTVLSLVQTGHQVAGDLVGSVRDQIVARVGAAHSAAAVAAHGAATNLAHAVTVQQLGAAGAAQTVLSGLANQVAQIQSTPAQTVSVIAGPGSEYAQAEAAGTPVSYPAGGVPGYKNPLAHPTYHPSPGGADSGQSALPAQGYGVWVPGVGLVAPPAGVSHYIADNAGTIIPMGLTVPPDTAAGTAAGQGTGPGYATTTPPAVGYTPEVITTRPLTCRCIRIRSDGLWEVEVDPGDYPILAGMAAKTIAAIESAWGQEEPEIDLGTGSMSHETGLLDGDTYTTI